MDILTAATIYLRCVYAQESAQKQMMELAGKLCGEKPAQPANSGDPTSYLKRENLRDPKKGLLATLYSEVNRQEYQEDFPITRPESKNAARNLVNAGREFYVNLIKLADANVLNSMFQKIINQWNAYKQAYLSGDLFGRMTTEKSTAQQAGDSDAVKKWDDRYYFWQDFVEMIDDQVTKIGQLIKDQLSGNSETPLQVEPV
jgi:hypothetical protein